MLGSQLPSAHIDEMKENLSNIAETQVLEQGAGYSNIGLRYF